MHTVIELETEDGGMLYLNPDHVVSVVDGDGLGATIAVVWNAVGGWRVKGNAREIAACIFSYTNDAGFRVVRTAQPGQPLRREKLPLATK